MPLVSVLYREPKLLKFVFARYSRSLAEVSVLYREPKLLKSERRMERKHSKKVSVLYREPKLLKFDLLSIEDPKELVVSVLYREPKLLKYRYRREPPPRTEFQCSTVSRNC